jgi:hypothetical protein
MDIVDKIASYARAVPAGLKAAGQELAKTASAIAGDDAPATPRSTASKRRRKPASRRAAKRKTVKRAKLKQAKSKQQPKAKRTAGKKRKAKR